MGGVRLRILIALALVGAVVGSGAASHCASWTTSTTEIQCRPVPPVGAYYVDEDSQCTGSDLYSIWVYEESNGLPGLQRQDEIHDDTCHGAIRPDTLIF